MEHTCIDFDCKHGIDFYILLKGYTSQPRVHLDTLTIHGLLVHFYCENESMHLDADSD